MDWQRFVGNTALSVTAKLQATLSYQWDHERRTTQLRDDVAVRATEIQRQLNRLVADVEAVAQLYNASELVTATDFDRFTRPFITHHPLIQVIQVLAWAPRITAAERPALEAQLRAEGLTHFAVRPSAPAASQPDQFPLTRLMPLADNAVALGFDWGSEPRRRAAIEQARLTGQPAATPPLTLVQEPTNQRSVLVAAPVFAATSAAVTTPVLRGVAVGALRLGQLVEEVLAALPPCPLAVQLIDPSVTGTARLLYQSAAATSSLAQLFGPRQHAVPLTIAGRQLLLTGRPAAGGYPPSAWPPALLALGLSVSAVLTLLLRHDRRTARALAEREQRLQLFVAHAPVALALFDRDMRYIAASRRWYQDYGLSDRDLIGQSHYDVFPEIPDRWREAHQRGLAGEDVCADAEPFQRADGSVQWLRWAIRPWRDAAGHVAGIAIFTEDITARYTTDMALQMSEERLRLALDAAQMGIFDWDVGSGQVVWSEQHERLWGFAAGEFDGTYTTATSRIHPDDAPGIMAAIEQSRRTRTPYATEMRVIWPDGSHHWIAGRGQFTFSAVGEPQRMYGVVMDITQRRTMETALHRSEERLRLALDAAQMGTFEWDIASGQVVWSEQHERLWGFAAGEFAGNYAAFASRVHPDDLARVEANHHRSITDRSRLFHEFRVIWPDGSVHWIAGYGDFTADGQATRMHGVAMDITQRHEMETALRESEHWLAESQRIAHVGSWIHELDGHLIWSEEHYRVWSVSPDNFVPTETNALQLLHPTDVPAVRAWIDDCLAGLAPGAITFRRLLPDGHIRYLSGRGELQTNADGRPLRMAGTTLDVTEMTEAYAALREREHSLAESQRIAHVGSWMYHLDGRISWSDEVHRMWQLSPDTFTPTAANFLELIYPTDRPVMQAWIDDCLAGLAPDDFVYRIRRADGEIRYLSGGGELQRDADGQPLRMAGTVLDVTEMTQAYTIVRGQQERLEEALALAKLAHVDVLTGIANRAGFSEQLVRTFASAQRHGHRFALINLDLDGFKAINDNCGHQLGDQVLRDVAVCLAEHCRPEDCAGRYGGDEFALLLSDAPDVAAALTVAERIRDHIAIMRWQGYGVSASFGVALFPDHAGELESLVQLADAAMYAAKRAGKNCVVLAQVNAAAV